MDAAEFLATFATAVGAKPLPPEQIETLLQLASEAAHRSERLAAPIACYLVGRAGVDPAVALEAARSIE